MKQRKYVGKPQTGMFQLLLIMYNYSVRHHFGFCYIILWFCHKIEVEDVIGVEFASFW